MQRGCAYPTVAKVHHRYRFRRENWERIFREVRESPVEGVELREEKVF